MKTFPAIFENGVFRPTEPVDLPEHCAVELSMRVCGVDDMPPEDPNRPIEEILVELAEEVPAASWAKLPFDLTDRLDYYLYGGPEE